MKVFLTLFNLFLGPVLGLNEPKLCVQCQYFIPNPSRYANSDKFGTCFCFPKKVEPDIYALVTGEQQKKEEEYTFCSLARGSWLMCGPEGKRYRKKYRPKA